jgi:hypothetical protein
MVKSLTSNINCIIGQYIIQPMRTFKKWLPYNVNKLCFCLSDIEYGYCRNKTNVIELSSNNTIIAKIILNKHKDMINWIQLSKNTTKWANQLLKNNQDKIDWQGLSSNPSKWACRMLLNNPIKTEWDYLSSNPSKWIYKLLQNNRIYWNFLSLNTSRWACDLLKSHPERINWSYISINQGKWACNLLKSNQDKIKWWFLSQNESHHNNWLYKSIKNGSIIIDVFNISWYWLSRNPTKWAYEILKNNTHRIHSDHLSLNTNKHAYNLLKINNERFALNQSKWAYKLLKKDKIYWDYFLAWNPYIFKIVKTNKYNKLFDKKIDI